MLISALVSDKECKELYKIGKVVENNIVEIGSFQGESTTCLAKGSIDGNKVKIYAKIDPCMIHTSTLQWNP